jgi:Na+-driven multidrug efflux pump
MLFPSQVISIFNSNPEFIKAGIKPIRIYSLLFFFIGIQLIPGFFFQAIGKGLPAAVISNSRQVISLLPLLIFLPKLLGITGLWVAFPISDTLALLFSALWMVMELRKQEIPILFSAARNTMRKAD